MLHRTEDLSPARGTCIANLFPLGSPGLSLTQGDPAALQMQTKGVTCLGCRLEPNGGRKKQLLGFLQLLLVFLLQRERGVMETPHLSGTGTAGDGSVCYGAADTGGFGKTA